jgi:hypothetical protein
VRAGTVAGLDQKDEPRRKLIARPTGESAVEARPLKALPLLDPD